MRFPNWPVVGVRDTSWVVEKRRTGGGNTGEREVQQLGEEETGVLMQRYILILPVARGIGRS